MPFQKIPLPGYNVDGAVKRVWWSGDYFGNNNYNLTSGDKINASDFGMAAIESVQVDLLGYSQSNTYFVRLVAPATPSLNQTMASCWNNVGVFWFYAANAAAVANATNLAAEALRLTVRGV